MKSLSTLGRSLADVDINAVSTVEQLVALGCRGTEAALELEACKR